MKLNKKLGNQKGFAAFGVFALVLGALLVGLFAGSHGMRQCSKTNDNASSSSASVSR